VTALLIVVALAVGFALGRARLGHRASQWAAWQSVGTLPARRTIRFWAMFTVLSAENIGWLIAHPVKAWRAWQQRNDPPPPRSPALKFDPDWAAKRLPDHTVDEET
jgi:uncharacterized membrane-anchored protein